MSYDKDKAVNNLEGHCKNNNYNAPVVKSKIIMATRLYLGLYILLL